MKLCLNFLAIWTCYSEILANIATVVKQFKPLLSVHKSDEFNGKMPKFLHGENKSYRWYMRKAYSVLILIFYTLQNFAM